MLVEMRMILVRDRWKALVNDGWFLFAIPNLIGAFFLLYTYNNNIKFFSTILLGEVIILAGILLVINGGVYLLLKRCLRNKQKAMLVLSFVVCFYFRQFTVIGFLLFLCGVLGLVLIFKKFIYVELDL